eukprot:TRINITY_DN1176_c0_g1_i5.p1 TRINITY_DN1176_c0_g1~~TRINITY_DN1176_c0_g1_i5.p1  ORF type:complete len:211 (-),score=6.98 TRINITY_DN1176_c0_g1_i5:167-799(-)
MGDCSNAVRIGVSTVIGALLGLILAEVIAYSLLEISVTSAFSYIFGVGFCLLGLALGWRIFQSVPGKFKKIIMMFFALLVLASGISCFFLQNGISSFTPQERVPLYMILGVSFAFSLTFSFSEILSLALCDRCCNTDFANNPVFGTPRQIFGLFATSLSMGAAFGILFGLTDVENDDANHSHLKVNTIYSIPVGILCGGTGTLFCLRFCI